MLLHLIVWNQRVAESLCKVRGMHSVDISTLCFNLFTFSQICVAEIRSNFFVGDIEKFLEKDMQLFIACKLDKYGNWGKSRALNVE